MVYLEVEVQSELQNTGSHFPIHRNRRNHRPEVRRSWIRIRRRELRMIKQVESVRLQGQSALLAQRKLKILLYGEVQIVVVGIADSGEIAGTIAKSFRRVSATGQVHKSGCGASSGKVECTCIKPALECLVETGRHYVADDVRS